MKINFVIPFTNLTGGIRIILEYANRLSERGHDVVVYTPLMPYKIYYQGILGFPRRTKMLLKNLIKGSKIDWFKVNPKVNVKAIPFIADKFIREADAVVATAWPTASKVYSFGKNKGKKVYFIQDYEIWHGEEEAVHNTYELGMTQIVIAKWLEELMVNKFHSKDTHLVYNGIDFSEFYNNNKSFDKETKTVTMMYHELESKGFRDGIEAFEIARKKFPNLKLKLFGAKEPVNIPEYAEYYMQPSREELRKIYSESDVFIFSSRSEGWGLTPLEAMACKCAVVATNTGAIKEIGKSGYNMLISNTEDINALADNLIELLCDEVKLKEISINGYEEVKKLDWEKSIDKFEGALRY